MSNTIPLFKLTPGIDHYGVMGNPIGHSLSPRIHRAFAEQTGQSIAYQAIEVPVGHFAETVEQFRRAGGKGLNVTVPFKQEAWAIAEQKSAAAVRAGAVNTLWFTDKICGDNTDGRGLIRDIIHNLQQTIAGKKILILGAGGAVRGVLEPLLNEHPDRCVIANRTVLRAEQLVSEFSDLGKLTAVDYEALADTKFDLIINGTSASLQGELPALPDHILTSGGGCYDMMYASQPTPFVHWGQQQGAIFSVDGLGMLVEQAAESFFIWRAIRPATRPIIEMLRD